MTARETLEAFFFELLDDPSEESFAARGRQHPDATDAALAYLRDRHVRAVAPAATWETSPSFHGVLRMILYAAGDHGTRGLVAVALDSPDPRQQRFLAGLVIGAVAPDDLARALCEALADGDEGRRANARELAYHTFDAAGEDYEASRELRERLASARAGRSAAR